MRCDVMRRDPMACSTMPYDAAHSFAMRRDVIPRNTAMRCGAMPCGTHSLPCYARPCRAVPCRAVHKRNATPCGAKRPDAMPCHAMPFHATRTRNTVDQAMPLLVPCDRHDHGHPDSAAGHVADIAPKRRDARGQGQARRFSFQVLCFLSLARVGELLHI